MVWPGMSMRWRTYRGMSVTTLTVRSSASGARGVCGVRVCLGRSALNTQRVEQCRQELWRSSVWAQFQIGWPDWDIRFHQLPSRGENVDFEDRIIWVDVRARMVELKGPVWAAAHAVGHLFHLDHVGVNGSFTEREDAEADRFADNWVATARDYRPVLIDKVA